jgi:hypothetical protein
VAERLGFTRNEALSLGKAVAELTAQTKGRRLGLFTPSPEGVRRVREQKPGEELWVEICGRSVPAVNGAGGARALIKDKPIEAVVAERYLAGKFGKDLWDVREAMNALANSLSPEQPAEQAFALYEQFHPAIPEGVSGWGAKGELDLDRIRSLAVQVQ